MSQLAAFITGVAGESLSTDEWRFLQDARPAGLILFDRNCKTPIKVRALIDQFKDAIGRDNLLVLVDQEGGRVQRMKPPHWRKIPAAAAFGKLYRADPDSGLKAARAAAQLVARELGAVGVNMNCAPVLDMPIEGAHQVIGARAFGVELAGVVALGRAVAEGILAGGLLPAIKHMPGHGRARSDTHLELPVVTTAREELLATDFAPFKALADLPVAMTAHVVFEAIDPEQPATTSATVIKEIIRGEIGFGGLLVSDDSSMNALSGSIGDRVARMTAAGCDLALHCNGKFDEMLEVAANSPLLEGEAELRFAGAFARRQPMATFDASVALAALEQALAVQA